VSRFHFLHSLSSSSYFSFSFISSLTTIFERHHLLQNLSRAVLFAGPGAIIVALLLAVSAKIILPFGWSWMYCLLFGAILCSTDPVSVVSLMKSTGCSTKLTMVISGESLLNDGSSMILYLFFFNMINGMTYTASSFILFCIEMLILSPLIGFCVGIICSRAMRRINTPIDSHLDFQLIFTFIAAYLSYALASSALNVSGVLSCCTAGFTVSIFAPIRILHDEKFHKIWHVAEWTCNTLIFLLAGIIGGGKSANVITIEKIGSLIAMFFMLLVTRGIMSFLLLPLLNWVGGGGAEGSNVKGTGKITIAETLFMTYAGLRGAFSIALALEGADNADNNGNEDIGKDLFFMVTGLASFTLLINGTTAGWVLLKLGLIDDPNAEPSRQLQQVRFSFSCFFLFFLVFTCFLSCLLSPYAFVCLLPVIFIGTWKNSFIYFFTS
jgi:NhaP-type Na+/H+ or K+/H+ antiporter